MSVSHACTVANSGVSSDSNYGGISSAVISAARHLSPRRHPQAAEMGPEAEGGGVHWSEGGLLPPCLFSPPLTQPPTRPAIHVNQVATRLPVTCGRY